jgi:uncharacterized integral membrane protein
MKLNTLSGILFLPFIVLVVIFSIFNRHEVAINLWPFAYELKLPFYLAVILISFIFFLIGALLGWLPALSYKHRLKNSKKKISKLEEEIKDLKTAAATKAIAKSQAAQDDHKKTIELKIDKPKK